MTRRYDDTPRTAREKRLAAALKDARIEIETLRRTATELGSALHGERWGGLLAGRPVIVAPTPANTLIVVRYAKAEVDTPTRQR